MRVRKTFLLLHLFLFVLLAALAVAFTPVLSYAEEANGEKAGEVKDKTKQGGKEDGAITVGKALGDPIYIHLQPMIMPVINENGAEQLVTLLIDLQVKNIEVADRLHANMPRVKDAIMRAIYGGLGDGSMRNGHMVSIARIKKKIFKVLEETFGSNQIQEVLIQAVSQRML